MKVLAALLVSAFVLSANASARDQNGDARGSSDHADNGNGDHNNGNGNPNNNGNSNPDTGNGNPNANPNSGSAGNPNGVPPGQSRKSDTPPASDQDVALEAVEDSRALPLEDITAEVHRTTNGEVIDARLVTVNGFLLYELKVLDGDRLEVQYYYARSGLRVGG